MIKTIQSQLMLTLQSIYTSFSISLSFIKYLNRLQYNNIISDSFCQELFYYQLNTLPIGCSDTEMGSQITYSSSVL